MPNISTSKNPPPRRPQPQPGHHGPKSRRHHRPLNWRPVAVYVAFVLLVGGGIFAWDRAYEARQRALFAPPPPPVLVRNLIEDVVGRGTVSDVKIDDKTSTLDVTVRDVLVKPGQSLDEKKKNLATEGTLAIQFVQSRLRYKVMRVHLVQNGKVLATVTVAGQSAPATDYASDLK